MMSDQPDKIKGKCGCGSCNYYGTTWHRLTVLRTQHYCDICGYHLAADGYARRTVVVPLVCMDEYAGHLNEDIDVYRGQRDGAYEAWLEKELAVTKQALLINSMHIAFLIADGKPDEYYMQVALNQAEEEIAREAAERSDDE